MFNPQDGVVHLVFANPNDKYILPSLVRLDLNDYICCQLRRNQCGVIMFTEKKEGKLCLRACGADSVRALPRPRFSLLGPADPPEVRTYSNEWDCAEAISQLLKRNQRMALVMDLSVLSSLHKRNSSFVQGLIGQLDTCRSGQNLLVLTSMVNAEESLSILTDPEGPFQVQDDKGRALCPEVQNILHSSTQVPLYESMRNTMGERMRVLNYFDRKHLNRVVDRVLLHRRDRVLTEQDQQDLVDLLYCWHQSDVLRDKFPDLMEENPWMEFSRLESELEKTEVWDRLRQTAERLRGEEKSVRPALEALCGPIDEKNMKLNIQMVDTLAERFRHIVPPEKAGRETLEHFYELRRFYTTAWNRPRPQEVAKHISDALDLLKMEPAKVNLDFVREWVDRFYQCGMAYSQNPENTTKRFYILYSVLRYEKKLAEIQGKCAQLEEEHKKAEDKADRLWEELPEKIDDRTQDWSLASNHAEALAKALNQHRDIEMTLRANVNYLTPYLATGLMEYEGLADELETLMNTLQQNDQKIETATGQCADTALHARTELKSSPKTEALREEARRKREEKQKQEQERRRQQEEAEEQLCIQAQEEADRLRREREEQEAQRIRKAQEEENRKRLEQQEEELRRQEELEEQKKMKRFLQMNDM